MKWDEDLNDEQKNAASCFRSHAVLLAGPGTGKTTALAHRVAYLMTEMNVPSEKILVITFTRAASFELRNRISQILDGSGLDIPKVHTLHSFALRQLLKNSNIIQSIPKPLRIADDWEEENIILEDLKSALDYEKRDIERKFNLLSADWQTLEADNENWDEQFSDPRFLSEWRHHRIVYGYTLRSELVYQLKRALEQTTYFSLETDYSHLIIDEYQDLNKCDLAIIFALRDKGINIFGAGDDDQSIYGFRYATPNGIRNFEKDFSPSIVFKLKTCERCDRDIIKLSLFVADQDINRIKKPLIPRNDAKKGEVHLLKFKNQSNEAKGVGKICKYLINVKGYSPDNILILMRNDRNKQFSNVIKDELLALNIPVSVQSETTLLDTYEGRVLLSYIRLLADINDNLAIRSLMMLRKNKIGNKRFNAIYKFARDNNITFSQVVNMILENEKLIPKLGHLISLEAKEILAIINKHKINFNKLNDSSKSSDLINAIRELANDTITDQNKKIEILNYLETIIKETDSTNHIELLRALTTSIGDKEQDIEPGKIKVMTMHKAKGLTADAVILIAAEDEYIPGRQLGAKEDDERRLLYVSLSRAKHFLAITYCDYREGAQKHTGRNTHDSRRTLTRFLVDAPIIPKDGSEFVRNLIS